MKRVGPDGSTAWTVDTDSEEGGPSSVLVSPDGTVYYSDDASIVALAKTGGLTPGMAIIIAVVLANSVVVAYYALTRSPGKSN